MLSVSQASSQPSINQTSQSMDNMMVSGNHAQMQGR